MEASRQEQENEQQRQSQEAEEETPTSLERLRQLIRVDDRSDGELSLWNGALTQEMVPLLFRHIQHEDRTRRRLTLGGREQLTFAAAFAEHLKTDTTLKELVFWQFYSGREKDIQGTLLIIEALKANAALELLTDASNQFGEKSYLALSDTLRVNTSLKKIKLGETTDADVVALASALETNETLQDIFLSFTTIGDIGAASLASALKSNKGLRELSLNGSNVGAEGAVALSEALKVNSTLRMFRLMVYAGRDFHHTAATAFGEALKVNTGLLFLQLPCLANWHLARACEANQTLQVLFVHCNNAEMADSLNHSCGRNRIFYHEILKRAPSSRFLAALLPYWASRLTSSRRRNTSSQRGRNRDDPWISVGLQESFYAANIETLTGPRAGLSLVFQYIKDCCEAIATERLPAPSDEKRVPVVDMA